MGKKTKGINNRQSGGIDFIRAKKKVGKKIKKNANVTDTTVRAKRINLPGQVVGTEGKGDALTSRGLSLTELLNQTGHYSERVRKDALEGIRELLENHPRSLGGSAAAVVEKTAERLVDREQIVRIAARAALKHGVLPALGKRALAPFAKRLVLHVGAALTHVDPLTRRDAPAALETLLDAAPELVAQHAPAATLRHLADLLRRGDDAASSALDASANASATAAAAAASAASRAERYGLSATFGDMTASRVGATKPNARLRLLTACRRFLETLVSGRDGNSGGGSSDVERNNSNVTTWRFPTKRARDDDDVVPFDRSSNSNSSNSTSTTHFVRSTRPPRDTATTAVDAFGGGRASRATEAERDDGRAGIPAAAADLAALLFSAFDECTPVLRDTIEGGGSGDSQSLDLLITVKCMTEALVCTRLALRLVDDASDGTSGSVPGAAAGAAAASLVDRAVMCEGVFPAVAPASVGAPERRALVAYNAAAVGMLSAAADGVAGVLAARQVERLSGLAEGNLREEEDEEEDSDSDTDDDDHSFSDDIISHRAADYASAAVAEYLASALRGTALEAGPCGEAEPTLESDYGELLYAARMALQRPTLSSPNSSVAKQSVYARDALVQAVGEVWSKAVVQGPPERRAACVALLAAALPNAAAEVSDKKVNTGQPFTGAFLSEDAAAKWLRPFARALWELRHRDPGTTQKALLALRTVASRATPTCLPNIHQSLIAVESELAPFFALAPPPPADPDAKRQPAKLGPFAKLPRRCRVEATALLGNLPVLSPATLRAVAHATLAPSDATKSAYDACDDVATRAVDAVAGNVAAAPLALSTSFFASVLTGAPDWQRAAPIAHSASRALAALGDGDAWAGVALAWGAIKTSRRRAKASSIDDEKRALYGTLIAVAVAAEASSFAGFDNVQPKKAPSDVEGEIPELLADALLSSSSSEKNEEFENASSSALANVVVRALRAAPRWCAPILNTLSERVSVAKDDVGVVQSAAEATSRVVKTFAAVREEEKEVGAETNVEHAASTAEAAGECVAAVRLAANKLIAAHIAGAARAASAARDATRDVDDMF